MKIIAISMVTISFWCSGSQISTTGKEITLNVTINNTHNSSNNNAPTTTTTTTTTTSTNLQTISSMVSQQWQSIRFDEIRKQIEQMIDRSKGAAEHTYAYCINNKKNMGLFCAVVGYGYIFYQLFAGHYYLVNATRWAMWKQGVSFALLRAQPEEEISQELLLEIQQRYLNIENPTDFLTPLVLFLQAVEEEIKKTTYYSTVYHWLNRCYCLKLFPINYAQLRMAREKKERLMYLKYILQLWIARHNIQANKKGTR